MSMLTARQRLRDWMRRSRLTQRAAAEVLGVHFTFVSQLVNAHRSPSLATAVRFERLTGIPVEAWMPTDGDAELPPKGTRHAKSKTGKG